ncbi:MAG: glycerophosphodiester phosphodiesterase [Methanoregula sp.]
MTDRFSRFQYIGHQGGACPGVEPNTINAFILGKKNGADIIEIDIYMTKTGEFIVNRSPQINGVNYWDINKKNCSDFENKQLLHVLNWASKNQIRLMLDIKNWPAYDKSVSKNLISYVSDFELEKNFLFISYNHSIIHDIKKINSDLNAGIMYVGYLQNLLSTVKVNNADFIETQTRFLTKQMISKLNQRNVKICSWCVNDKKEIDELLQFDVDFIKTDCIKKTKQIVDEMILGNK